MKDRGNIIERLKAEPERTMVEIYRDHRNGFISWLCKRYSCDEDFAADCFQDAVIVVFNNVRGNKLTVLSSEFKTYLFSIGKNIFLKEKTKSKTVSMSQDWEPHEHIPDAPNEKDFLEEEERINKIARSVMALSEPCKSILKYYYYHSLRMDEIANKLNYKSANTVKSQKIRCMKYLEEMIKKNDIVTSLMVKGT